MKSSAACCLEEYPLLPLGLRVNVEELGLSISDIFFNIKLTRPKSICCKAPYNEDEADFSRRNENQLAKFAIVTLAVSVLALGSVGDASAARSGRRIGGLAFRTNIYVNPPLIGGYGYGYGGWGWSPFSFFGPGPGS
ncbi:hypothetical protein Bca101_011014 [Brassica carinata]